MTKIERKAELRSKYVCFVVCVGLLVASIFPSMIPAKEVEEQTKQGTKDIQQDDENTEVTVEQMEDVTVTEPEVELQEPVIKETEWQTYISKEYLPYIEEICESYNICPAVVIALIEAESNGNPNDVSKRGAIGLMQVVPKWHWERMEKLEVTDLFDPYSNILAGVDFLAELFHKYQDLPTVLMCYNEGEYHGAPERAMEGSISEYAKKVMERASELQRMKEGTYE